VSRPRELDAPAIGLVLLLSALWGGNTVAIKVGLLDAPPLALGWMRFVLGGIYQGVLVAGFNFIALMWVRKVYRPSAVAAFSLTTPLFGVVSTALWLAEPITWTLAASAVLVIALASLRPGPGPAPAAVAVAPGPARPRTFP